MYGIHIHSPMHTYAHIHLCTHMHLCTHTYTHTPLQQETRSTSCTGPDCSRVATPPSVYCSDRCIERHAAKMLRVLAKRGVIVQTTPGEFVRGGGGVSVVERATGKMVMGLSAPSEKKLVGWLKTHPSYQVFLPHGKGNDCHWCSVCCSFLCGHCCRVVRLLVSSERVVLPKWALCLFVHTFETSVQTFKASSSAALAGWAGGGV